MKIVLFDVKSYDKKHFEIANKEFGDEITYYEPALNVHTAVMAKGSDVVCPFVNCTVDKEVIDILKECGVKLIAMRSAGFNNVDYNYAHIHEYEVPFQHQVEIIRKLRTMGVKNAIVTNCLRCDAQQRKIKQES